MFYTPRELKDMTCQIANVLKEQGVQKGDIVAIYMPVSLIAAATMLACTRIGAVHRYRERERERERKMLVIVVVIVVLCLLGSVLRL